MALLEPSKRYDDSYLLGDTPYCQSFGEHLLTSSLGFHLRFDAYF
jgi:hypothetical protein